MPVSPIDLIRRRVARANDLTETIAAEQGTLPTDHPEAIRAEENPDGLGVKYFAHNLPKEPLSRWAILFGDAVHNLRSSLDNTVYALWASHTGLPADRKARKRILFPIYLDLCEYESYGRLLVQGVIPEARAVIESEQPYHRRDAPYKDVLWRLRELSNLDKHRAPTVSAMILSSVTLDGKILDRRGDDDYVPMLEDGAQVGELRFIEPPPAGVEVETDFTFDIRVLYQPDSSGPDEEGWLPIVGFLREAVRRVERIVGTLAEFVTTSHLNIPPADQSVSPVEG